MKSTLSMTALLSIIAAIALPTLPAYAADAPAAKQKVAAKQMVAAKHKVAAKQKVAAKPTLFSYKVPLRGAPATRVGGGTRSAGASAMTLKVLAPIETGYTVQARPTIYWYVSETITNPVEITITGTGSLEEAAVPLLEITLQAPIMQGIHALRLEEHELSLKPDVEYQWFVAVVKNPDQRSDDLIAGGSIKRVAATQDVQVKLNESGQAMRAAIYAESGIWYDAIDQLSKQIVSNPANRDLHEQRAALLEQVGLGAAAAYDRGSSS